MLKEIDPTGQLSQCGHRGAGFHFLEPVHDQQGQEFAVIQSGMEAVGAEGALGQGFIGNGVGRMVGRQGFGQVVQGITPQFRVPGLEQGDGVEDGGGGEGQLIPGEFLGDKGMVEAGIMREEDRVAGEGVKVRIDA